MSQSYIYFPCTHQTVKAVTIVVHGLNNKPTAMMALVNQLLSWRSDVFLVQLSGHTAESSKTPLTEKDWVQDLYQTYQQATATTGAGKSKPLYFLGYSLGALVNLHLITIKPEEVYYDKMVLVAPALSLRTQLTKLLQLATDLLPPLLKIPSLTPKPYRAGAALPVKAYTLLYKMAMAVEASDFKGLSMPVLVIMDTKDEMVSYQRLSTLIGTHLTSWQLYTLPKNTDDKSRYAHLILDERSVGKNNWVQMLDQIKQFLQL